jgi:serine/threonine-protein kinase
MRQGLVPFLVDQGILPFRELPVGRTRDPLFLPVAAVNILLSLALFALTRSGRISSARMVDFALAYFLITSLIGGFHHHQEAGPPVGRLGISWATIWILIFSMFVPAPPRKMLPVLLIGAFVDPVAEWIAAARSAVVPESNPFVYFFRYFLSYIAALIGVIHSKVVLRLTRQVGEAREMGSYRLQRPLGEGGMGEVWQASHRMLARPAAVKLIRPEMLDPGNEEAARMTLQRFEREAQATAALHSPHTVELFDFGISADGTFYYVMELLEGLDLNTLVKRFGPVSPARTVYILRQACHSLADAHAAGLVHRDIKPANIYVCRKGLDYDFTKVLDFGLVKSGDGALPGDSLRTRADLTTGTPAFISPESALGESDLDGRADIYALGCVAYWMLTGHLVFEADTPMKMVLAHARDAPAPLRGRSELDIPDALSDTVMTCLEKDRESRPASAAELSRHLNDAVFEQRWSTGAARRWWEAHLPDLSIAEEGAKIQEAEATFLYTRH